MELKDLYSSKPGAIQTPSFLTGTLADLFFPEYETLAQGYDSFRLRRKGDSNPFSVGLANKVLADNGRKFRTPTPTDNIYQTIFPMIEGKYYIDLNTFDVGQWTEQSHNPNKPIWEQLVDLAKTEGVTTFPFRAQGFYCIPDKSEPTYNVRVEPADNFRVIQDDKLNYSGRFSQLDEYGICIPDLNGRFIKYTLGNGVSRVCLDSDGGLISISYFLVNSDDIGRVVVIDAEGVA